MNEKITSIFGFIKKNLKWFAMAALFILVAVNANTCSRLKKQKDENLRLHNNIIAMNDTLKNYKDGIYNVAEMRALQLRVDELADSLKMERNKKPITIVKYITSVRDSFSAEVKILHDTLYIDNTLDISDVGTIFSTEHSTFGKSSRSIKIETPYYVNCNEGKLYADGESSVVMDQNIWVENVLYSDKKGYTYLKLKTDYPGINFNSGTAIVVSDPKDEMKKRKSFGFGIGLQAGYGIAYNNRFVMSPYIGIGIGLQWNPKFLQF